MKYIFSLILFFSVLGITKAQNSTKSNLKFNETEHDFGSQQQGKPLNYEFKFTNNSTEPIVLENVKASCGCTTPTWTKEPVMPNKTGNISVQYNMAREGAFRKSITVTTKDGENITLFISGNAVVQNQGVDLAPKTIINE